MIRSVYSKDLLHFKKMNIGNLDNSINRDIPIFLGINEKNKKMTNFYLVFKNLKKLHVVHIFYGIFEISSLFFLNMDVYTSHLNTVWSRIYTN